MSEESPIFEPLLFCFCGPTASGKSTICRALLPQLAKLRLSISTTTRDPRPNERDGVDYYFVSQEQFQTLIESQSFLEHASYNNRYYGTEKKNIDFCIDTKSDLLLDIEVQGVSQLKEKFKTNLVTVFVFPRTMTELKKRLANRATETPEQIARRLEIAEKELDVLVSKGFSDYLILNDDLNRAVLDAEAIIRAERLKLSRLSSRDKSALRQ